MMIFLILNLFLLCENLKSIDNLNNNYEAINIVEDYTYDNSKVLTKIETAINLANFKGTSELQASESDISLTLSSNYFKYILDELKGVIDIASINYLDEEFVLLKGLIK